jgi:hypothetical protein
MRAAIGLPPALALACTAALAGAAPVPRCYLFHRAGVWIPATNPLNAHSTIRKGLGMQRLGPGYTFTGVVTSAGLTTIDNTHFDNRSARLLGVRYAEAMLKVHAALEAARERETGATRSWQTPRPQGR